MIIPDIVKGVVGARVVNILFVCYRLKIKYIGIINISIIINFHKRRVTTTSSITIPY